MGPPISKSASKPRMLSTGDGEKDPGLLLMLAVAGRWSVGLGQVAQSPQKVLTT